jgi:hypothetical protein
MKREGVRSSLGPIHQQVIIAGITYFRELKEEALDKVVLSDSSHQFFIIRHFRSYIFLISRIFTK